MTGDYWSFAFVDANIQVETSRELLGELAEFEMLKIERLHIMLSEGGWVRFKRDPSGRILVGYHLARLRAGAAVHGEVVVQAESTAQVCKQLAALL